MIRRSQLDAITLAAEVGGAVVALKAKGKDLWPLQEASVHPAMRKVA